MPPLDDAAGLSDQDLISGAPAPSSPESPPRYVMGPNALDAVFSAESGWNPSAVSPKGAKGTAQVMDATNLDPGFGVAPAADNSPQERQRVGQDYAQAMLNRYGGDPKLALMAYNWGPGNVDKWLDSGGQQPVPTETKNYVDKLLPSVSADIHPDIPENGLSDEQLLALGPKSDAGLSDEQLLALGKPTETSALSAGAPSDANDNFLQITGKALLRGAIESGTAFNEWPTALEDRPSPAPDTSNLGKILATPVSQGWSSPTWWAAHMAHMLGSASPSLAMGLAGGALGTAAVGGPEDPLAAIAGPVGGALGFGMGSALSTLAPAYQKARAEGLDHDAAVDRAMKETGIAGTFATIMGLAPGASIFGKTAEGALKAPISEALAQIFAVQPAIGAAQQEATGAVEGRAPTMGELATGYAEYAGMGAGVVGAHAVGRAMLPSRASAGVEAPEASASAPGAPQSVPEGAPSPDQRPYRVDFDPETLSHAVLGPEDTFVKTGFPTYEDAELAAAQANDQHELALNQPQPAEGDGTAESPIVATQPQHVEEAAARAEPEPSEAQKEAGNYAKGHIDFQGLPVTIETAKDAVRRGPLDANGVPAWENVSPAAYGYIKKTTGADGEHVDAYIGDHPESQRTFVVDQVDPRTGAFDEHKAILGAQNQRDARAIYDAGFSDGSGPSRRAAITEMPIDEFKNWLKNGDTTKPVNPEAVKGAVSRATIAQTVQPVRVRGKTRESVVLPEMPDRVPAGVPEEPAAATANLQAPGPQAPRGAVAAPRSTGRSTVAAGGRPMSLVEFLARQGGLRDENGELGADAKDWRLSQGSGTARVKLVRPDGMSLGNAFELAQQYRYLPPEDPNAPATQTEADLLDLIDSELHGKPTYSENDRDLVEKRGLSAQQRRERDPAYTEHLIASLQAKADRLGVAYTQGTAPEELAAEVAEREALLASSAEADSTADGINRSVDGLVPELFGDIPWEDVGRDTAREVPPEPTAGRGASGARGRPEAGAGEAPSRPVSPAGGESGAAPEDQGAGPRGESETELEPKFQRAEYAPTFYSALQRGVEAAKQDRAPGAMWKGYVRNLLGKGVKQEEIDWSGLPEWLDQQKGPVTKRAILDYLRENEVQIQDVTHGEPREETVPDDQATADHAAAWDDLSARIKDIRERERAAHYAGRVLESANLRAAGGALEHARDVLHGRMVDETRARQNLSGEPKFSQYTLPAGKNYRELLLTLPVKATASGSPIRNYASFGEAHGMSPEDIQSTWRTEDRRFLEWEAEQERALAAARGPERFHSPHWEEPNVLAHVRFDDRVGPNGEKDLHIAEIQSDWHQKGKRTGYVNPESAADDEARIKELRAQMSPLNEAIGKNADDYSAGRVSRAIFDKRARELHDRFDPLERELIEIQDRARPGLGTARVPNAPFKTSWPELAFKRMLRYAAANGYDRISWDTGETQAERYDLSKQIDGIKAFRNQDGTYSILATPKGENRAIRVGGRITEDKLADHVGKDLAEKIAKQPNGDIEYSGLDLKAGGEGMKAFYDRQLPIIANKIGKKFGAKVEDTTISTGGVKHTFNHEEGSYSKEPSPEQTLVHSIPITPEMRRSVMESGQPLFQRGVPDTRAPGERVALNPWIDAVVRPSDEFTAHAKALLGKIMQVARRIAPGAETKVYDALFGGEPGSEKDEVYGAFHRTPLANLIAVALRAKDGIAAIRHETVHFLKRSGLLSAHEWGILKKAAEDGDWLTNYDIAKRYGDLPREAQLEEAIAEAFAHYQKGRFAVLPGSLRAVFAKIAQFFRQVAAATRQVFGREPTADDIFTRMESGAIGRRGVGQLGEGAPVYGATEKTDQGEQFTLGEATGHETPEQMAARQRQAQKAEAEARMLGPKQARRAQSPVEETPLFGGKGKQETLFQRPDSEDENAAPKGPSGLEQAPEDIFPPHEPPGTERPIGAGPEVEQTHVPSDGQRHIDATSQAMAETLNSVPVSTYDRVLQRVSPTSNFAVKNLNPVERFSIFPATIAKMDTLSSRLWVAWKKMLADQSGYGQRWRAMLPTFSRLDAASRAHVYGAEELARIYSHEFKNDGTPIRVRNTSLDTTRFTKRGDNYVLTPQETKAYFERRAMFQDIWKQITAATAKRMGWDGDPDVNKVAEAARNAPTGTERRQLGRIADLLTAMRSQERTGYVPLMRFGRYYIAVKPKAGVDKESLGGSPELKWFETVERPARDDILGRAHQPNEPPKEALQRIAELRKQFPADQYDIEHGDLFAKASLLRDLNIPAVEKLMMLMENNVQHDLAQRVMQGVDQPATEEEARTQAKEDYSRLYDNLLDTFRDQLYKELKAGFKQRARTVPGYDPDFDRTTGAYMHWTARHAADLTNRDDIERAYQQIQDRHPHQAVKQYWKEWRQYQEDPTSPLSRAAQTASQVGFTYALAMNPASTLIVAAHTPMAAAPTLSVGVGMGQASRALTVSLANAYAKAGFDLRQGAHINVEDVGRTPAERAFLAKMENEGLTHSQGADDVRALTDRQADLWGKLRPTMRRAFDIASSNIRLVDQANRVAIGLAAFRMAQNPETMAKIVDAWKGNQTFAEMMRRDGTTPENVGRFMLSEAAFDWGRENRAPIMRGPLGTLLFTLHGFQTRYLSTALKLMKNMGPEGRIASMWMMGALAMGAGAAGLPFFDDTMSAADKLWQHFSGHDPMLHDRLQAFLADAGLGKIGAEAVMRGPLAEMLGTELTSRIGFGDIISRQMSDADIIGTTPLMMWERYSAARARAESGQGALATAAELMPSAVRNPLRAVIESQEGLRSQKGRLTQGAAELTDTDLLKQALGFRPLSTERAYERGDYYYRAKRAKGAVPENPVPGPTE